jgi:hypothetical protein
MLCGFEASVRQDKPDFSINLNVHHVAKMKKRNTSKTIFSNPMDYN